MIRVRYLFPPIHCFLVCNHHFHRRQREPFPDYCLKRKEKILLEKSFVRETWLNKAIHEFVVFILSKRQGMYLFPPSRNLVITFMNGKRKDVSLMPCTTYSNILAMCLRKVFLSCTLEESWKKVYRAY